MKKLIQIIIFLLLANICFSQDIIYKNDKTEIKAKVLEISDLNIKYKKFDMQDGPTYTINTEEVFMIIYKNGTKEIIQSKKQSLKPQNPVLDNVSNSDITKSSTSLPNNNNTENSQYRFTKTVYSYTKNNGKVKMSNPWTFFDIGFSVDALRQEGVIIPNIFYTYDVFMANNFALSGGTTLGYSSIKIFGNTSSTFSTGILLGGKYYLNEIIKIPKEKASLYAGISASFISVDITTKDAKGNSVSLPGGGSSYGFGVYGNVGGRYHLNKNIGILAQVNIARGGASFLAGISILKMNRKLGGKHNIQIVK